MFRRISLSVRRIKTKKEHREVLERFADWENEVGKLPANLKPGKHILIIRLDDIGDYLLFRNSLSIYKKSPKWAGYQITLLGNQAWKSLYERLDVDAAHKNIWVNKNKFFDDETYRKNLWAQLRSGGYEVVICPARCHPLLIDDICMLAAAPETSIAPAASYYHKDWNHTSNKLYNQLYTSDKPLHEFFYNIEFANWCCGTHVLYDRPMLYHPLGAAKKDPPYILCFVGGSKKSHQWPAEQWIALIKAYGKKKRFVIAGGPGDVVLSAKIASAVDVDNITGTTSLVEMIDKVANADAVVSNDTMTSHMAVACNVPTVIVANGDNFYKFSEYERAGIKGVRTVYPDVFMAQWKAKGFELFPHYVAVTNDISTISWKEVLNALNNLLN